MEPSQVSLEFLGDHKGMPTYNMKYKEKNLNDIRHILSHGSNSTANFEVSLRDYKHKIEHNGSSENIGVKSINKIMK